MNDKQQSLSISQPISISISNHLSARYDLLATTSSRKSIKVSDGSAITAYEFNTQHLENSVMENLKQVYITPEREAYRKIISNRNLCCIKYTKVKYERLGEMECNFLKKSIDKIHTMLLR